MNLHAVPKLDDEEISPPKLLEGMRIEQWGETFLPSEKRRPFVAATDPKTQICGTVILDERRLDKVAKSSILGMEWMQAAHELPSQGQVLYMKAPPSPSYIQERTRIDSRSRLRYRIVPIAPQAFEAASHEEQARIVSNVKTTLALKKEEGAGLNVLEEKEIAAIASSGGLIYLETPDGLITCGVQSKGSCESVVLFNTKTRELETTTIALFKIGLLVLPEHRHYIRSYFNTLDVRGTDQMLSQLHPERQHRFPNNAVWIAHTDDGLGAALTRNLGYQRISFKGLREKYPQMVQAYGEHRLQDGRDCWLLAPPNRRFLEEEPSGEKTLPDEKLSVFQEGSILKAKFKGIIPSF